MTPFDPTFDRSIRKTVPVGNILYAIMDFRQHNLFQSQNVFLQRKTPISDSDFLPTIDNCCGFKKSFLKSKSKENIESDENVQIF